MYKVKFDTGQTVSFQNQPTDGITKGVFIPKIKWHS